LVSDVTHKAAPTIIEQCYGALGLTWLIASLIVFGGWWNSRRDRSAWPALLCIITGWASNFAILYISEALIRMLARHRPGVGLSPISNTYATALLVAVSCVLQVSAESWILLFARFRNE
jgi:hypothetical protein